MRIKRKLLPVLVARGVRVGRAGGARERLEGGGGVCVHPEGPERVVEVEDYERGEGEGGGQGGRERGGERGRLRDAGRGGGLGFGHFGRGWVWCGVGSEFFLCVLMPAKKVGKCWKVGTRG